MNENEIAKPITPKRHRTAVVFSITTAPQFVGAIALKHKDLAKLINCAFCIILKFVYPNKVPPIHQKCLRTANHLFSTPHFQHFQTFICISICKCNLCRHIKWFTPDLTWHFPGHNKAPLREGLILRHCH